MFKIVVRYDMDVLQFYGPTLEVCFARLGEYMDVVAKNHKGHLLPFNLFTVEKVEAVL